MTEAEQKLIEQLIVSNKEVAQAITLVGKDIQRFHNSAAEGAQSLEKSVTVLGNRLRDINEMIKHLR